MLISVSANGFWGGCASSGSEAKDGGRKGEDGGMENGEVKMEKSTIKERRCLYEV